MLIKKGKKQKRGRKKPLEKSLRDLYYNLKSPSSYSGARKLLAATRGKYDTSDVVDWLQSQDSYNSHKLVKRRFPRRPYNIYNIDDVWETDICDMKKLKNYNDGYAYILVCIDTLSKYVFTEPLRDKSAQSVADAIQRILGRSGIRRPLVLQSDKGGEFMGAKTQKVLRQENILFRETKNDVKASVIERFLRTLKERIWRYFTHKRSHRYIDVLDKIVYSYNNAQHSAIKMTPASVNFYNAREARGNLLKRYATKREKRCKYKIGDLVRISEEKKVFDKSYEGKWTTEIFKIVRISTTRNPVVYYLHDLAGEPIDCFFYEEELSRVKRSFSDIEFEIEEVIATRGKGKNKELFVKWLGYGKNFNSWIKASKVIES